MDHNASAPVRPEVVEVMSAALRDLCGNPSSLHWYGQQARRAVDRARGHVADLVGAEPEEIVLLSGGTEANNLALDGALAPRGPAGRRVIISAIEHQAVLHPAQALQDRGAALVHVGVDSHGLLLLDDLAAALAPGAALVSIMLANNDVGTVQPLEQAARAAREAGALVHTDAVQAVGKIPVDVGALGVDLLSLSGHKLGGPKGVGALYVREGTPLAPQLLGGHHERLRRAGTENLPGIVGLGEACRIARVELGQVATRVSELRDGLEQGILGAVADALPNGHPDLRLPNTSNIRFCGLDGEALLLNLDLEGIAVSNGSACTAGTREASHVLLAMGQRPEQTLESVRFSLGPGTTRAEVERVVEAVAATAARLREGGV